VLGAHSPADVVLSVLFLHALSPSAINNVVPGGWSIGVEMVFYLLAPLAFFLTQTRVRLVLTSVAVMAASAMVMWLVSCNGTPDCNGEDNTFLYFWPPGADTLFHPRDVGMVCFSAVSHRCVEHYA
jgi:peptidoglycan/LPS O-acetylase OafA/YrhL